MANIIIDTNIFRNNNFNLESASFAILDKYVELFLDEKVKIIMPNIIMQEIKKVYKKDLKEKYSNYQSSVKKMGKVQYIEKEIPSLNIDIEQQAELFIYEFKNDLVDKFGEQIIFEIESDYINFSLIIEKCINGQPPFSSDGRLGFRDCIIWEVIKHYVNDFSEVLIFISKDSDFINKETKTLHASLNAELNKSIKIISELDELDLTTIMSEEESQLITTYQNIFKESFIAEHLKELIIENIDEYIDFPSAYDDVELTEFGIYNPKVINIVEYTNYSHIIKIEFDIEIRYNAFIFKTDYYSMLECKGMLGDFDIEDGNFNDYMALASVDIEYKMNTLFTFNIETEEIEDIQIVDAKRTL